MSDNSYNWTPEDRQRREALLSNVRGISRGRGGLRAPNPQFSHPLPAPPTSQPTFDAQHSNIIPPPQGFHQIVDPVTGQFVYYSVEQSGEVDTSSSSRRRRYSAGDQPIDPIGSTRFSQNNPFIDPVSGQLISYSVEQQDTGSTGQSSTDNITSRGYQTMAERYRDPVTGKPNWNAMRAAIEEENRFRVRQPYSSAYYGQTLAEKSRAETMASKEHLYERSQRKADELHARGYSGLRKVPPVVPQSIRWTRTAPILDQSQRRMLLPQTTGVDSSSQLRRTMSAPDLSDLSGRDQSTLWSDAMKKRRVFNSQFLQNKADMRRVGELSQIKTSAIKRNLTRTERRHIVSNKAKIDVVIKVEDLTIDIHPIPEENEELHDVWHSYDRFHDMDDDDEPPPYDGYSFVR